MLYRCNVYVRPRDQMTFATFANNSVILFENAKTLRNLVEKAISIKSEWIFIFF